MAQDTKETPQGIINFRDVGYTVNQFLGTRRIREGLIFRSARPDDATSRDRAYLSVDLGIKTVIDLRTSTELVKQRDKRREQCSRDPSLPQSAHIEGIDYHEIKLTGRKFESQFIFLTIFRYRLEALQVVSQNILVPRGLLGLARDMLDLSGDEITEALSLCTSEQTTPVLVHCTQGKDRTGLICALVLMILDVPIDAIEHDYFLSNAGLETEREKLIKEVKQIGLTEEWVGTSKDMVVGMQRHLDDKYGGLEAYLDGIGFNKGCRVQLRDTLLY
ncbi:hypothetical protein K4F52_007608 [Lecanicillium sp. MT-2017a]|nr:hypothetical protein K4F52_007608 [Lecanicillium sp. MT-2017a]